MAFTIRNQKDIDSDVHEQLYNNVLLLSMEFPTTPEFNANFKKDMFVKNNKAAFQHVVHFLLNVFDPVAFKQKVCWPILDTKMEVQFRKEVMKYINEITTQYEDCGIPLLMTSHIISPGGYKFVRFMHKLSDFVLLEYLKRDESLADELILPIKADNDSTIASQQLKHLNNLVENNYNVIIAKQFEFNAKYNKIKEDAQRIMDQKQIVEKTYLDVKYQYKETQEKMKAELPDLPALCVEDMLIPVQKQLEELQVKESDFKYCAELVDVLSSNSNILKYNKQRTKSDECVDLVEFLESFYEFLEKKKYIAQLGKNIDFPGQFSVITKALETLNGVYSEYETLNSELLYFLSQIEEVISNFNYGDYYCESALMQRVKKIYEPVPFVNIRFSNLM